MIVLVALLSVAAFLVAFSLSGIVRVALSAEAKLPAMPSA